jgi:hypothetical protein
MADEPLKADEPQEFVRFRGNAGMSGSKRYKAKPRNPSF